MGDKVGKECLGTFGADEVTLQFLQATGKTVHILSVSTIVVETAAYVVENPLETGPVDLRKVVHPSYCTSDMLKCSSFFL